MRLVTACFAFAFGLAASSGPQAVRTAVVGGTLIDPESGEALKDSVVILHEGRVERVGPRREVEVPKDARIIDASGKWIVPGLVDAHMHFFQSGGLYARPDALDLRALKPYEQELADVKANLDDTFRRYLASGVTAVADVGGPFWNFEVRKRAAAAYLAPHVAVAGPLISTYRPPGITEVDDPPIIKPKSAAEARELVRQQALHKPDFVKIWYIVGNDQTPEQHLDIVRATIDEARAHGIRVAVHATELETARAAVRAGADILVHSVMDKPVDEDFIALLRQKGVIYTPTLIVMQNYLRTFRQRHGFLEEEFEIANPHVMSTLFDQRAIPEESLPARIVQLQALESDIKAPRVAMANLKTLHDAGVIIAAGTDAGNMGTLHGASIFREFDMMAMAGLKAREILATATLGGARLMNRDDIGRIAPGAVADLVILDADPLQDIRNLARVDRVIRGGVVASQRELLAKSPADVVQQQVNAYNARDIDAFTATFAPDVEVFDASGTRIAAGRDELRKMYAGFFENNPRLHCRIIERTVEGNIVTDKEQVTGLSGDDETIEGTVTYEVEDALIRTVRLVHEN